MKILIIDIFCAIRMGFLSKPPVLEKKAIYMRYDIDEMFFWLGYGELYKGPTHSSLVRIFLLVLPRFQSISLSHNSLPSLDTSIEQLQAATGLNTVITDPHRSR